MTHICVGKLTIIGSDNGLSPGRHKAIIWTNAEILLNGPLRTNFSEIFIEIHTFSFKKMHFKMSSGKWRPFCLGLNVLTHLPVDIMTAILQTTLPNAFWWTKSIFYCDSNFTEVCFQWSSWQTTLVQVMAWRRAGDKTLPEPMLTHYIDAYMRHWCGWAVGG